MMRKLMLSLPGAAALLFILLAEPLRYSLPLICSVLLHEASHLAALRLICGSCGAVTPVPFGLSISLTSSIIPYKKEILICAAGPAANIICTALCVVLMRFCGVYSDGLLLFMTCNLLLGVINLIPIKTLDGGRILLCTLLLFTLPDRAENIALAVSITLIFLLWFIAVYLWMMFGQSPYLIFLSMYLFALSFWGNKK